MMLRKESKHSFRKTVTRPILFWWQGGFLAVFMAILWVEVPFRAIFSGGSGKPYHVTAQAAYVHVDPAYAQAIYQKTFAAWLSHPGRGGHTIGLESEGVALNTALGPPTYFEKSRVLQTVWQPAPLPQLPIRASTVHLRNAPCAVLQVAQVHEGLAVHMSDALKQMGFVVSKNTGTFQERSGSCQFFVETDEQGSVQHVMLLSAVVPDSRLLERLLICSHARGAARGTVQLSWVMRK